METGHLTGDVDHVDDDGKGWGFRDSYAWMQGQMARRVAGYSGDLPVWAWPKRPSMRTTGRRAWLAEPTVLVVADVPLRRVVASDYDTWHMVLNGRPMYRDEAEFDAALLDDDEVGRALSWEGVFDIGRRLTREQERWHGRCRHVQFCCDRILLGEMVRVVEVGPTGRVTATRIDRGPVRPRRGQVPGTSCPLR